MTLRLAGVTSAPYRGGAGRGASTGHVDRQYLLCRRLHLCFIDQLLSLIERLSSICLAVFGMEV